MDRDLLIYEMKKRGLSVDELCKSLNISRSAFYRKCGGKTEFKLNEIKRIAEILNLESLTPIFLQMKFPKVNKRKGGRHDLL